MKTNKMIKVKIKKEKGITLIALVVTIIILIILAAVSMNLVLGENGLLTKAQTSVELKTISELKEALELEKPAVQFKKYSVNLDDFIEQININNEKTYEVEYIDRVDDNNAYIVINSKYKFLLKDKLNGDVEIIYQGEVGTLKLSSRNGTFTYPINGTFEVETNESKGELSVTSSDENIAKVSISGNVVTIEPGKTAGVAKITVKSKATEKYPENMATYEATIKNGELEVSVIPDNGAYDNLGHGITVTCNKPEAKIEYSLDGNAYSEEKVTYKDVGVHKIYYKVTLEGYTPILDSEEITISKADGKLELSKKGGGITFGSGNVSFDIVTNKSNGNLTVQSNDQSIATASISGNTVTVTPKAAGNTKITVTSAETENYKETTAQYEINVFKGIDTSKYAKFTNYQGSCNLLLAEWRKGPNSSTSVDFTTGATTTLSFDWVFRGSADFKMSIYIYVDGTQVATWTSQGDSSDKYKIGSVSKQLNAGNHTITLKATCSGSANWDEYYGTCVYGAKLTY